MLGNQYVRGMAASVAIFNFFGNVGGSILLVYLVRELGLSATTIGIVLGVGNVGFLVGAILARRVEARLGVGRTIVGSSMLSVPGLLLVPLAPHDLAVPVLIASGVIVGFAIVLYNVTAISLMQAITPDRLLGRMNASRRFFVWGVIPLGAITGGVLASTIGLRPTLFVGAIGASLAVLPLLLSPIRSLVRVPDEDQSSRDPVRQQRVGEALPRQVRLRSQPRKPVAHRRQPLRVGGEPGERLLELLAGRARCPGRRRPR